jgi:anti-sigma B factor antagonist
MAKGDTMTIEQTRTGKSTVTLTLHGRLDTANAPLLEQKIKQWGDDITELTLDFAELEYISSMGLRVLLQAKKTLKEKDRQLVIKNMGESIREVFEMTGFLHLMVKEEKFVLIRKIEDDATVLFFNGQMEAENVEMVEKELSAIKEAHYAKDGPVKVILDMENLSYISAQACKFLRQAVDDTKWIGRKLHARNVSVDMEVELKNHNLIEIF